MKPKKSSGKGKRSGNRGIKDLPVSDAKAKDAKGGLFPEMQVMQTLSSQTSEVLKSIGNAINTAARD